MLTRRTPLRRTRFMRGQRRSKYRLRQRDFDHMLLVKKLPCCALGLETGKCNGPIEADHVGRRGMVRSPTTATRCPCAPITTGAGTASPVRSRSGTRSG